MSQKTTTTIEVSRRNRRRLDARRDAVREKTGKARVSLDDVISDLLDSAGMPGKGGGVMSGIGVMTAYNQILAAYPVRPSNMNEVWDYVAEKYPQYEEGIMIGAVPKEQGGFEFTADFRGVQVSQGSDGERCPRGCRGT